MEKALEQSIIKTLAYFDIFDYPLTREELFSYLWEAPKDCRYLDFVNELEKMVTTDFKGKIENTGGYYFFSGRQEIVAKRERKIEYTEERMKIAKRGTQKLRYIPFFQALFVCNQLPIGVKQKSDIDVFIVVKKGRIWLTRFFITLILSIFSLRRSGVHIDRRLCLSFYVTEDNLNLSNICIETPDVYQAYWNATLIPVYDPVEVYKKIREKNAWVETLLPFSLKKYESIDAWKVSDNFLTKKIRKFFEFILSGELGNLCEKYLRFFQLGKMKRNDKNTHQEFHKNIVISDAMLKFHENDRKQYFKDEWEKRWKSFI
jgi:hypothetical protein